MGKDFTNTESDLGFALYTKLQKNGCRSFVSHAFDALPVEERNAYIKTAVEMDEAAKLGAMTYAYVITGQHLYELIQHQLDSQGMHDPVSFVGGWVHLSVWLKRAFEEVAGSIPARVQEPQDKPEVLDVSWIVEHGREWHFFDTETDLLEWWVLNREDVGRIFRLNVSNQELQCVVMGKDGGKLTLWLDGMPGGTTKGSSGEKVRAYFDALSPVAMVMSGGTVTTSGPAYIAPTSTNVGQASLGDQSVSFRPGESILGQFRDGIE